MSDRVLMLDATHPDTAPDCVGLRCENCGVLVRVKLPVSVVEMSAITESFGRRHSDCALAQPAEEGQR